MTDFIFRLGWNGVGFIFKSIKNPWIQLCFFKSGPTPASFPFIFGLFKRTLLQFLQQINVKNVHPVCGAGIRTHNLMIPSLLP